MSALGRAGWVDEGQERQKAREWEAMVVCLEGEGGLA